MIQNVNTQEPVIHVGITSATEIVFVLNGSFTGPDRLVYSGKKVALYRRGKILFNGEKFDELSFEPITYDSTFDLKNVPIGINFHWERRQHQRFKGSLKFIVDAGRLTVINRIPVEEYLSSVISSEMSATASVELLKAHAVISRSWLLNPILNAVKTKNGDPTHDVETRHALSLQENKHIKYYERNAHEKFDVCADDHCQRYQGITRATTSAVRKAIEATRGEMLMYEGRICDARFSKSCGGASETFGNCWAPEHYPYLTKVIDNPVAPEGFELDLTVEAHAEKWIRQSPEAFCNTANKEILSQVLNNYDQETTDFYRWKVEYTQAELAGLLARRSGIDFGQILDLVPVKRGESGRIIELKIVGTKETVIVGKELEIRKWLSSSHLYSSAFVVDKQEVADGVPQHFALTGAGWGHGVGLCQIGAAVMGEKGYKYDEILMHYFNGAELKRIY